MSAKVSTGPENRDELAPRLSEGLAALDLALTPARQNRLLTYIRLLEKWNRSFNLTAIRDAEAMISAHLLDSLSVLPFLKGPRVLDVGAGAGLPGLPLAVARPDWDFVLLDSNGKKTRFMQQAVFELALDNVEVVKSRIEQYRPGRGFDTVISRAFSSLADFAHACEAVAGPGTRLLAMKGRYPQTEWDALAETAYRGEVRRLKVPGVEAERHLVTLWNPEGPKT